MEKKFMFVIPATLYAVWGTWMGNAILDSGTYIIIEANGLVGASTAKKGSANGVWNIKGTEGTGTDQASHRKTPITAIPCVPAIHG